MASVMMDFDYTHVTLFYGLHIHKASLSRPLEAYAALNTQFAVLDILEAHRIRNASADHEKSHSASSKFPQEIWDEIRSWMIPQYLAFLRRCAQLGIGKSCDAEDDARLRPKEEWTCSNQQRSPSKKACFKCQHYLDHGFRARYRTQNIQESILAIYGLYLASEYSERVGEEYVEYLGIAVHPPVAEFDDQSGPPRDMAFPISLPFIDQAKARKRMAAFLDDFGLEVKQDPLCDRMFQPEEKDWQWNKAMFKEEQKRCQEEFRNRRRKFPPKEPRWMIAKVMT